jgi:hypothetical protein
LGSYTNVAEALRTRLGAIAQLGERVLCKHDVVGSIPSGSTISLCRFRLPFREPAGSDDIRDRRKNSVSIESLAPVVVYMTL